MALGKPNAVERSLKEADKALRKQLGINIGGAAPPPDSVPRLCTGIASLDVALGGGWPLGGVSIIYGHEGAQKTSLALRIAAQFQKSDTEDGVVWIDAENSWDSKWAALHGVDLERILVYRASTAEEAANIVDQVSYAEDCGLVIIDSIAALSSLAQIEENAEKTIMAGGSQALAKIVRKTGTAHTEHAKRGHRLTTIYVNQVRISLSYGNPEILPGPSAQRFQSSLTLRLRAKTVMKEKVAKVPVETQNFATIKKNKLPIASMNAEWVTTLYPHDGKMPLDINNRRLIEYMLVEVDALQKHGKEWLLWGEVFPTKTAAVDAALENYDVTVSDIADEFIKLYGG